MRTAIAITLLLGTLRAAEPTKEQAEFFESKVRPILAEKCFSCHSESAKKLKGNLLLDSKAGLLAGGDSGPAIVEGKPNESKLIEAIKYGNEDLQMPPKQKLKDAEIEALTKWVSIGAPWPNSKALGRKPGL